MKLVGWPSSTMYGKVICFTRENVILVDICNFCIIATNRFAAKENLPILSLGIESDFFRQPTP